MSRIDKAIEIATRKRGETAISNAEVDAGPVATHQQPAEVATEPRSAPPRREKSRVNVSLPANASPCLIQANAEGSPVAEQYRKLKSVIAKLEKAGKCGKTLMVTSAVPGEGKTFTAVNLAISLAQEFDHTVLLIEADLRKPSILEYLGLQAERGLSDCILDGVAVDEVIVGTGIGGLSVLSAGRPVGNPVELFSSNKMEQLFAELKARDPDRFVIVDTTPLLPFAEPQFIASAVDGVLLVVRENMTSVDKLKRALEILKSHNLLGVISNGVSRMAALSGYHGYYGYRY
jgi:exopolysaccharide/PEP-CTERM locus tyrosine autokinase